MISRARLAALAMSAEEDAGDAEAEGPGSAFVALFNAGSGGSTTS